MTAAATTGAFVPGGGAQPGAPSVLVTTGTDVHPFDRLVDWADRLAVALHGIAAVLVQHGHADPARTAASVDFLGYGELRDRVAAATVVVTHGGPGSIMGARDAGHRPVVVPRDPLRGEHVDDHQQRFAALLVAEDRVDRAEDYETLERLVALGLAAGRPTGPSPGAARIPAPGVLTTGAVLDELLRSGTGRGWRR
jgi:UDP-N-acetylglucosamine transferase subunit ALG13